MLLKSILTMLVVLQAVNMSVIHVSQASPTRARKLNSRLQRKLLRTKIKEVALSTEKKDVDLEIKEEKKSTKLLKSQIKGLESTLSEMKGDLAKNEKKMKKVKKMNDQNKQIEKKENKSNCLYPYLVLN